ncbi:MAG: DUF1364 family protein [Rhodobacteraceae bacterium]|nr:DUF1364 family protein [Paracoccaceae bacterium]
MTAANPLPSQKVLSELLRYDPKTGRIFWRERPREYFKTQSHCNAWNGKFAGAEAFSASDKHGYRRGEVVGHKTSAHRVIWKLLNGSDPKSIDHINGDPSDNRIENLRSVTHRENCRNRALRKKTSSGHQGVSWANREQKWRAYIALDSGVASLGYFDRKDDAISARKRAEIRFGYHKNHGRHQVFRPSLLPKVRSRRIMAAPSIIQQKTGVMMPCTLRICSILGERCSDPDTNVMAHLPGPGKGTATKVTDLATVCACHRCHQLLDQPSPREQAQLELYPHAVADRFFKSLIETQAMLFAHGIIEVPDGELV